MSAAAQQFLTAFDALPADDQALVLSQLLRRPVGADDMLDAAFVELADELFQTYDAAEATDAAPTR